MRNIIDSNDYMKTQLLVKVATLYYENNDSQNVIAEKLGFSRPYVSKLLAEAQKAGIVSIMINDPSKTESRLEREIRQRFELRRAIVVPVSVTDNAVTKIGIAAARYLNTIVKNGDTIAAGSGNTIYTCAKNAIERADLKKISVVQLNGFLTHNKQNVYEAEIPKRLAAALGGTPYILPVPAIVDDPIIKEHMLREKSIADVMDKMREASIVLFTVGIFSTSIALKRYRILNGEQIEFMIKKGAVGDILMHFLDISGRVCDPEFDGYVITLTLDELKRKEYRIAAACGRSKIDAICAALNGGYANVLITDEDTAEGILERLELLDAKGKKE